MIIQMRAEELIPFDSREVLGRLGLPQNHPFGGMIQKLIEESRSLARPKALFRECEVTKVTKSAVCIDGITLTSPFLAKKMTAGMKIYPALRTCGGELAEFGRSLKDFGERYAFDAIMDCYQYLMMPEVISQISESLPRGYILDKAYPGETPQWDIREQKKLFALFGEDALSIGVTLNDRCLMTPLKSVSCLYYSVKGLCEGCNTCRKKNCAQRQDEFQQDIFWAGFYRY